MNERHINAINHCLSSSGITLDEIDTADCREDFQPQRGHAEPNDLILSEKQARRDGSCAEAEGLGGGHQSLGVFRRDRHPNDHILGCAVNTVMYDGVAADDQVLNSVQVEQLQELSEVVRKLQGHR